MILRCTPAGIFSWNFYLEGEGHRASLGFDWLVEQGTITADDVEHRVSKHGALSGYWTLERAGQEIASGKKASPFSRTFELQAPNGSLTLRAESPLGRSFRLERSGDLLATFCPHHPFTRRSTIETFVEDLDFSTICLSFWLAVVTWRRRRQNNS